MANIEKIKKALVERFEKAGWNDIKITMNCNGDTLVLTPCAFIDIRKAEDIEYIIVCGSDASQYMGGNLDQVADQISRYQELVDTQKDDKIRLAEYCEKHQHDSYDSDSYQSYSDWHKDVYGFRPNGWAVGVSRRDPRPTEEFKAADFIAGLTA